MGNHPSAVVDDGRSSIHRQSYTVRGELYARAVSASTVNAKVIYARRITCQRAQISRQEPLQPYNYPQPPHRAITAHTLNVDALYVDEINCKTLRAYDVFVGEGNQFRANRVERLDRNQVGWDGKEDEDSDASENESDGEETRDADRARRKKMMTYGAAGAVGLAIGGAALAYGINHHKKEDEEEAKKKEEEERRRWEEEVRRRDEEKRKHEQQQQQQQQQHHQPPPYQQPMGGGAPHHDEGRRQQGHVGNYQMSSRNVRLWSDGNHCFLIADCDAGGNRFQESRLDLDNVITNSNGEFRWVRPGEPGNFSGTAQRWEIVDRGNVIVADLQRVDGSWHRQRFDLSERITNENGNLRYLQ